MTEIRTYILILYLPHDTELDIGSLGTYDLPTGYYAYVDQVAAHNLAIRLKKHLSPGQTPKNHIDYLQQVAQIEEIWLSSGTTPRRENWADLLASVPGGVTAVEGFGVVEQRAMILGLADELSSAEMEDTYLIYFDIRPLLEDFALGVRKLYPNDIVLRAYTRPEPEQEEDE